MKTTLTIAEQSEIMEMARWITKCPSMAGPAGTTAYIIKPDIMRQLKWLVISIDIRESQVIETTIA